MHHYLKKGSPLISLPEPLDPDLYDNIGSTAADYHLGRFIPLTETQAAFRADHPGASVAEILAEAIEAPGIDDLRASALRALDDYDRSPAVNSFTLGGQTMWLDKATRVGLANSIAIEAEAGRAVTRLWFGDTLFTLPIPAARRALALLELYALDCYNTTAAHRAAILALDTPEAVEAYDFTTGYPPRLNLDTLLCDAEQ